MALAGAEKSLSKTFFVVSQIFVILALYSLYDEGVVRRPWKHFQQEFNQLQMQVAEREYQKVIDNYKAQKVDEKIKKLELDLEEAVIAKESPEYLKLEEEHAALQIIYDDKNLAIKFNKSILDSYYYEWKHAFQQNHAYKAQEKRYKDLEEEIENQKSEVLPIEKEVNSLQKKLNSYDERIAEINEQIAKLNKPIEEAQKVIYNIKTRQYEIEQVVITDYGIQGNIYWGRVDRCQTCHVAADKGGFEDVVKSFGLTVVADEAAKKQTLQKDPSRRGWVITEAQKKHFQIMYGTHPKRDELFGIHPVSKFGCTTCHGGDGRGLNIKGLEFGEFDKRRVDKHDGISSSGYAKGVFGGEDKAHAFHHHAIESLLRGNQSQSNCLACHNGQLSIPHADKLTRGVKLFVDLGCHGCHLVKGYEDLYKVGPELNRVASKVKTEWLVDWIKNPKHYMPNSRMPHFGLTDDEVAAVASYFVANSQDYQPKLKMALSGNIARGQKVFEEIGCQGCHRADGSEKTYAQRSRAPNLSRLSSKIKSADWLYDWIKNPKSYSPHSRMPSLRVTNQEAADITAYLMAQGAGFEKQIAQNSGHIVSMVNPQDQDLILKGKKVMTARGCYGCHNIKGFDGMDRIGPELSAEALKESNEFDFGDALKQGFGFTDVYGDKVFVTHQPEEAGQASNRFSIMDEILAYQGYQRVTNLVDKWQSWIRNKMRYPLSIYQHDRAELKMPNFQLSDDELDSLLAFVKALQKREVPQRFDSNAGAYMADVVEGQKIIAQYNCEGCHSVQSYGGDINAMIAENVGGDTPQLYPPSLDHVGIKIRPEWLYSFLEKPTVYRPAVKTRMPSFDFDGDQLNSLVRYFAGLSKVGYDLTRTDYHLNQDYVNAARIVAGPEAYNCSSCHLINGKAPGDDPVIWAPDWKHMRSRLQYDFIIPWIKDPVQYQKFAVMPGFLNSDDEAYPELLDSKAEKQLEALRDYILSIGQ